MKKLLRRVAKSVWPSSLLWQAKSETIIFAKFTLSKLTKSSQFRGKTGLKVNIGCGENVLDGYVNIDVVSHPKILFWDCRRNLPFDDNSVELIFAEHVFEHFEYPEQTSTFLKECHRCLKDGGVVRLVVPDGALYLSLYCSPGWDEIAKVRPLDKCEGGYKEIWTNTIHRTKMEFINFVFRQGFEHKFIYDATTLILHMRECGFETAQQCSFEISASQHRPIHRMWNSLESLFVEGIKSPIAHFFLIYFLDLFDVDFVSLFEMCKLQTAWQL